MDTGVLSRRNGSPAATAGSSSSPMMAKIAAVPHWSLMEPARVVVAATRCQADFCQGYI